MRCGDQQVGLAAEEGRNLNHVDHLAHGSRLPRLVDVGQQAQAPLRTHVGEHLQPLLQAGAAKRRKGGAVGLVK